MNNTRIANQPKTLPEGKERKTDLKAVVCERDIIALKNLLKSDPKALWNYLHRKEIKKA